MGKKSRPSFKKRRKEIARQEKQQEKQAQRLAKSERRKSATPETPGEDPDIRDIRPGPQPLPAEWRELPVEVDPKKPSEEH
jgi:hypothetical protein